eukprot:361475-Chlamydomonas_euryale.AAC.5
MGRGGGRGAAPSVSLFLRALSPAGTDTPPTRAAPAAGPRREGPSPPTGSASCAAPLAAATDDSRRTGSRARLHCAPRARWTARVCCGVGQLAISGRARPPPALGCPTPASTSAARPKVWTDGLPAAADGVFGGGEACEDVAAARDACRCSRCGGKAWMAAVAAAGAPAAPSKPPASEDGAGRAGRDAARGCAYVHIFGRWRLGRVGTRLDRLERSEG